MNSLALFSMPGGTEWIFIGVIALVLFGKRLPDVARSFGKSIVEFKKGIRDVRDDIDLNPKSDTAAPRKLSDDSSRNTNPARTTTESAGANAGPEARDHT